MALTFAGMTCSSREISALRQGSGAFQDFLERQILVMGGDLPYVAKWIFHGGAAVAVKHVLRLFDGGRAGFERSPVRGVHVVDVEIEEGRHRIARTCLADHYDRIAEVNF